MQLFKVLSTEGYSYLCSMQTSCPFQLACHIFVSAPLTPDTNFFMLLFSINCQKVSLINAPLAIIKDMKKALMYAVLYGLEEDGSKA